MSCKEFALLASNDLDETLSVREAMLYHAHLAACAPCRARREELRRLSELFREVRSPEVPRELHGYVMTAIERRVRGDISLHQQANEWLLRMNPKPLSYATGVVLSVILFAITLAGIRPIQVGAESPRLSAVTYLLAPPPPIVSSDQIEFNLYNDLPTNASITNEDYYELPHVNDPSSLISFSHIAYQKPGNEGMAAVIEVEKDGRSRLLNVLDEPSDPTVVEQLWWTLSKPTFQPATVEGQPVSTRIILLVEKMDVDGAIR
jgi:hypothetical protein